MKSETLIPAFFVSGLFALAARAPQVFHLLVSLALLICVGAMVERRWFKQPYQSRIGRFSVWLHMQTDLAALFMMLLLIHLVHLFPLLWLGLFAGTVVWWVSRKKPTPIS